MVSSQVNKSEDKKRISVSLSLKRSVVRKLTKLARERGDEVTLISRSRIVEELLEGVLK